VLPGSNAAADVEFGYGHWDVHGEWDWMLMSYHAIPFTRREDLSRGQARLGSALFTAVRAGYLTMNRELAESYEVAAGFRPNTRQISKLSYEIQHDDQSGQTNRAVMVQPVTTIPLSVSRGTSRIPLTSDSLALTVAAAGVTAYNQNLQASLHDAVDFGREFIAGAIPGADRRV
jgi:hypothetical protein